MKISTKGRYALRMLLDMLQQETDGYIALKDIARRQQISKKYLEQIAMQLTQAGVLVTSRGQQGGYRLVGRAEDYTVADVLRITEGSMRPVACMDESPNTCERCTFCLTLPVWEGLDAVVQAYLASITLRDILDGKAPERARRQAQAIRGGEKADGKSRE